MLKVAVLDDYQNAFQQIVEVDKHKDKFELYHFAGASFIVSGIYLSNKKTND